ncbi:salt tolerance down-regulator-domain-containing protein, partial [Dendryphion nanum]
KKTRKKKKASSESHQAAYNSAMHGYHSPAPLPIHKSITKSDRIWNTSTQEERERIREFWLSLGEEERKSLVKIEKEAVLRKMKEQQKHSCSCTVCGRKRTAIEEELEVLYDAYYEELEQYANHQQDVGPILPPSHFAHAHASAHRHRSLMTSHPPAEIYDEADDLSQGEDGDGDQDYSNSEITSEDDYSSEERSLHPGETDFLQFGSSLQVKGGILTVADDLLKNDGKKFIEMMEQLAERRMQREEEAQYQTHPNLYRAHGSHSHPADQEAEYDDEDDEEEGYEDDDYEDDEDDEEEDTMTEEQRMEEGRRMFQIFAARMFEQRVLQAYREKVAAERQQKLLEELAEEDDKKEAKEAKKAKEAAKRREKKEKQKQVKAEEKARKDAEIAAKEAELKAAEEKRLEEQRRKKEELRKKREMERKSQEEEKQRKETERLKRQFEERERQLETERKAREVKAQEKKIKDDARRKEREEREAREKEAREKKAQEDKDRKEKEAKARVEKERVRKDEQAVAAATSSSKKPSQPAVALPPGLLKQSSSTGFPSPHVTPAVPKAPTPNRPRQSSQQDSHGSSPKTPYVGLSTSKSMSPTSQAQHPIIPKSILTKPPSTQHMPSHHTQPSSPLPPIGPPPGMGAPPGMGISMPPGLNGFPHSGSPIIPGMNGPRHGIGHNMSMYHPQPGPQQYRGFPPPPGMPLPNPMSMGRNFPMDGPPGFGSIPGFGVVPTPIPGFGMGLPSHSRQGSGSFDKPGAESAISATQAQPIQRPAPIQRPSSVKPHEETSGTAGSDIDELANHLGSKALLDDGDDLPDFSQPEPRRPSVQTHGSLRGSGAPLGNFGFPDGPGQTRADSYAPFGSSSVPNNMWAPPLGFPMGGNAGWGNSPTTSLFNHPFPNAMVGMPRPNDQQRIIWVRRLLCQTCKSMARQSGPDGFLDISDVRHQLEAARNPTEQAPSSLEIREACDIFGDAANGGGILDFKETSPNSGNISHIKFVEDRGPPPAALGEIGSPVPGHSVPAGSGFGGRPFHGLGQQGF